MYCFHMPLTPKKSNNCLTIVRSILKALIPLGGCGGAVVFVIHFTPRLVLCRPQGQKDDRTSDEETWRYKEDCPPLTNIVIWLEDKKGEMATGEQHSTFMSTNDGNESSMHIQMSQINKTFCQYHTHFLAGRSTTHTLLCTAETDIQLLEIIQFEIW